MTPHTAKLKIAFMRPEHVGGQTWLQTHLGDVCDGGVEIGGDNVGDRNDKLRPQRGTWSCRLGG